MKKSISIFVILALLGFKKSLYSQENESADHLKKQKDSKFFILELGPDAAFFYTDLTENRDLENSGFELGLDLLLTYRFTSFFDLGFGGFFNGLFGSVYDRTMTSDFVSSSRGWNAGGQVKFLFFPKVLISPYIRISIGYDRTTEIFWEYDVQSITQFNGIRYTVSGGASLEWKNFRYFTEVEFLRKRNISVPGERSISIDRPNIQDSIGYISRIGVNFNIYFN